MFHVFGIVHLNFWLEDVVCYLPQNELPVNVAHLAPPTFLQLNITHAQLSNSHFLSCSLAKSMEYFLLLTLSLLTTCKHKL